MAKLIQAKRKKTDLIKIEGEGYLENEFVK